ncbi:MAG TPA: 50S ribosomal protein L31e [Candidatus Nitrosocosmicus sp.]|jgi:large subunit ribosomal protein L31e|nr:50S ribosomal protein L31e [Candidatus Nitrosocosmicus sp.]
MSNIEDNLARIYTINFSKAWLTPKHKRTDRVINMIKEFATKHMKSSQIKIDQELNRYIWEKGKTNPPRKVRVRIVKDDDEQVIVSLYEDIILDNESRDKSESDNEEEASKTEPEESGSESKTTSKNKDDVAEEAGSKT